jgi:RNA polymerase subunit RPABC4/transcription elongation factor Spt4
VSFLVCKQCGSLFDDHESACPDCGTRRTPNNGRFCSNCGASISLQASFCSVCGKSLGSSSYSTQLASAPLPAIPTQPAKSPVANTLIAVSLILGFVIVFLVLTQKPETQIDSTSTDRRTEEAAPTAEKGHQDIITTGEVGRLAIANRGEIIVCIDVESLDEVTKFAVAHDNTGIAQLMLAGGAYFVEQNTRVRIIERAGFLANKTRIRILSGAQAGRDGWVPSEFVVK